MPQESLRSNVYRSFVSCDDPGGIMECKTIRRSKTAKKMGGKVENTKSEKNFVTSSQKDISKETSLKCSIDILDSSSSVRLKEVSKGAQKLSEVVDSLSKNRLESQPEDVAKKLLKGAVSLQESLKMMGKFQEASKFMTSFKKKEKKEKYADVIEFQKPRFSGDGGSSKDCYDELRDVIRESFARHNLLQKVSYEGREFADRNLDSTIGTPSASSSQSSMFNSRDCISSGSSSSNVQSDRPKRSNLIAKLMGLDELTSNPDHFVPMKLLEKSSKSISKRPILDLDLPIARNPSFIFHKAKPDKRTLGEIIEIMQSKGIMRDKSFDEPTQKWSPFEVGEFSDSPPIVVIKPLHNSSLDKEYPLINNCTCGRASSDTKEKLWRKRESVSSENVRPREALNNSTMQRKAIADKHTVTRISKEKAAKSFAEARARRKDKESEIQDNRSPIRPKASSHVTSHLKKGEVIEKGVENIPRVAPRVKNGEEMNRSKESNSGRYTVSKANCQENINSKLINNISGESIASSSKVRHKKSTVSKIRSTKTLPSSAMQRKTIKTDKLVDERTAVAVEIMRNTPINIEINPQLENEYGMMETRIIPEHAPSKEGRDISDIFPRESTGIIIQQNLGAVCDQTDNTEDNCISSSNEGWKSQSKVRAILSSSASFLNYAEELFDTTTSRSLLVESTSLDDDTKLILACATELLECKCQQWEVTAYPLLQHPKKRPKISVSFEHLVGKICDEIVKLNKNSRLISSDDLHMDYFYAKLKNDLWCNGAVAGAWDLGWMNAFSWDEIEQIVVDLEEQLLGVMVEDLVSDFLL